MADYYEINPFKREVSFAVLPIDSYTGKPILGKRAFVLVKGAGQAPISKEDGCRVFVNLPRGLWRIETGGGEFFSRELTADTRAAQGVVIPVRLTPNACYMPPKGSTFIDSFCEPGSDVFAFPMGKCAYRLKRQTESGLTLRFAADSDLTGQLFAFYEEGETEIFEMGKKTGKLSYNAVLKGRYENGAGIYPVSAGRADANGRLRCLLRGFEEEHKEVFIRVYQKGAVASFKRIVSYKRGNALSL